MMRKTKGRQKKGGEEGEGEEKQEGRGRGVGGGEETNRDRVSCP